MMFALHPAVSHKVTWAVTNYMRLCVCHIEGLVDVWPRRMAHSAAATALRIKKKRSVKHRSRTFVDWRLVRVFGGSGGNGCVSFLRLFCNPTAGPDGGDGGNGGHVIFQSSTQVKSLEHIPSEICGENGEIGRNKDCHGKCATHTIIKVPIGTIFKTTDNHIVADLDREGSMFLAARGGAGGKGNYFFTSDTQQKPQVAEFGAAGETLMYSIEMRSMAHVGLIGFPNSGKSTLLRAISRARPKIAAYPFTTLNPHIGMVQYDDFEQVAVADIPGLIPEAHKNRGLGITFLRHIERCLALLYILDLSEPEPWQQLDVLRYELNQYQLGLADRPHAVVANKVDLPEAELQLKELQSRVKLPIVPISAKYGNNLQQLLFHIRHLYDQHNRLKDKTL